MLIKDPPARLTDSLWMLGATAYPLYLYRQGDEAAIFEGGVGAMAPVVCGQIDAIGVGREQVKQLVITHAHPDHVMAAPLLREAFPGIAVVASETAARTLAAEKAVAFFGQIDQALTGSLLQAGWIGEEHRPPPLTARQIAVDRTVKEGDAIAVGGKAFRVMETPGHSDCSLSFYEPDERILLISDATGYYLPGLNAWWPNYFADYGAYLRSIRRLAGMEAELLCLSHNGAVRGADDVRTYFAAALEATEAYHRRIVEETRGGKPVRQLAEELGREAHERSPLLPVDFFQKNCAILVKQSLKHEGIAAEK
jgi:glyoxylase-like metal-dependent hydrolase (beta-lactamase superfamily II)